MHLYTRSSLAVLSSIIFVACAPAGPNDHATSEGALGPSNNGASNHAAQLATALAAVKAADFDDDTGAYAVARQQKVDRLRSAITVRTGAAASCTEEPFRIGLSDSDRVFARVEARCGDGTMKVSPIGESPFTIPVHLDLVEIASNRSEPVTLGDELLNYSGVRMAKADLNADLSQADVQTALDALPLDATLTDSQIPDSAGSDYELHFTRMGEYWRGAHIFVNQANPAASTVVIRAVEPWSLRLSAVGEAAIDARPFIALWASQTPLPP